MGLEVEFPCPIHRMAAGPAGALLVQLDDWIMAVEPLGPRTKQARRYGGETLIAPTQDGRAMVLAEDGRVFVCDAGKGISSKSIAMCNLRELVGGEVNLLGTRMLAGGRLGALLGVADPKAETNISSDTRFVIFGGEEGVKVFPSMGSRMARVWGLDEKKNLVMAGALADRSRCARVSIETEKPLPDQRWLAAGVDEPPRRVVRGDCTSAGKWCLAVEQDPDRDEPDLPLKRSLWFLSELGKPAEARVELPPELGEVRAVNWSPDGVRAAVRTDGQISLCRAGDRQVVRLCGAGPTSEMVWWPAANGLAVADGRMLRVVG